MANLMAGVHCELDGAFVSFDNADLQVIRGDGGDGGDAGTVALQIGPACVWISDLPEFLQALTAVPELTAEQLRSRIGV